MAEVEFRVWNEGGDLIDVFDAKSDAEDRADEEREKCPCGGDLGGCGVLHPHGIFVQIVEDGRDVTGSDYGQWD